MTSFADLIEPAILAQIDDVSKMAVTENRSLELTHNRFDLAFKLYYLEGLNASMRSEFREDCYKRHLRTFSGRFSEPDNPRKNSYEQYKYEFRKLYISITEHGFDIGKSLIPLANDGSIINGAHRTAIAIFFGGSVGTVKTPLPPPQYDYRFFKDRGMPKAMLDAAALTFAKYDSTCFLATIWPAAQGRSKDIESILSRVVFRKDVSLTYNGAHSLLAETYKDEPWLGPREDNYPGLQDKLSKCFPNFRPIRVYLFKADSLAQVMTLKSEIRALFNISNHSVHITDDQLETIRLGQLLFNENGIHFLNCGRPHRLPDTAIDQAREQMITTSAADDDVILDENLVMALYGLRTGDFQPRAANGALGQTFETGSGTTNGFYAEITSELADNPNFYFFYRGIKFVSLKQIHSMKMARRSQADLSDIRLISSVMTDSALKGRLDQFLSALRLHKLLITVNLKRVTRRLLVRLGILELVKRMIR